MPATGIIDGTMGCAANQSCGFTLSRLDVVASNGFSFMGMEVETAQVQNQGLINGTHSAGDMVIPANAIEAEVSATLVGGGVRHFHVRNDNNQQVRKVGQNLTLDQFLSNLDITMNGSGQAAGVRVQIHLQGTPAGHRPVSAITPQQTSYECQCRECTTATFVSAATDQDSDLQSLSWKLNGVPQTGDGSERVAGTGPAAGPRVVHVSLVATDSRGAAAGASLSFNVVDTTPPVVTAPPVNMTFRSCDFPDIPRLNVRRTPAATRSCISSNSPGNFPVGTTTVTWTAEDPSGNQRTATQTMTVTNVTNFQTCCPAGYNVIIMQNGVPTSGTTGNDCIIGTDNNDNINGGDGDDYHHRPRGPGHDQRRQRQRHHPGRRGGQHRQRRQRQRQDRSAAADRTRSRAGRAPTRSSAATGTTSSTGDDGQRPHLRQPGSGSPDRRAGLSTSSTVARGTIRSRPGRRPRHRQRR